MAKILLIGPDETYQETLASKLRARGHDVLMPEPRRRWPANWNAMMSSIDIVVFDVTLLNDDSKRQLQSICHWSRQDMRIRASGETYQGNHEALISKNLFDRVQDILHGRVGTRVHVHDFPFRRFIRCAACGNALIGELQKGRVYYRCHTKACVKTSVREDHVASLVDEKLRTLVFSNGEKAQMLARIGELKASWVEHREQEIHRLTLQIDQLTQRLNRTTDAYLEGVLDREAFEERKAALITERRALTDRRADYEANRASVPDELQKFVELAGAAYPLYCGAITTKKRRLLRTVMSNCTLDQKRLDITWQTPFRFIAEREKTTQCAPHREIGRTSALLVDRLFALFAEQPTLDFSIMDL